MEWDIIGNDPIGRDGAEVLALPDIVHVPVDLFFIKLKNLATLAVNAVIDSRLLVVTDSTGIVIGDWLGVFSGAVANQFYFGEVLAVAGNNITVDSPLDFAFEAGDQMVNTTRDLNVDGSITPQTFEVRGPGQVSGQAVDITRIMIQMTCDNAPDFGKFGDIVNGLTNGVVLRQNNGVLKNIWNIKLNLELANYAYDYTVYDASNPAQGVHGIAVRYTFGGRDKHGTNIRLFPGETLELIIQDNLSTLLSFRIIAEGRLIQTADKPEITVY